jgi:hypothetical protein
VSEVQVKDCTTGPVDDVCQQDDGEDDDHQPEEKNNDSGDGVPGYRSRSSHGPQLPGIVRLILTAGAPATVYVRFTMSAILRRRTARSRSLPHSAAASTRHHLADLRRGLVTSGGPSAQAE